MRTSPSVLNGFFLPLNQSPEIFNVMKHLKIFINSRTVLVFGCIGNREIEIAQSANKPATDRINTS